MDFLMTPIMWIQHKLDRCGPVCPYCVLESGDVMRHLGDAFEASPEEFRDDHQLFHVLSTQAGEFHRIADQGGTDPVPSANNGDQSD